MAVAGGIAVVLLMALSQPPDARAADDDTISLPPGASLKAPTVLMAASGQLTSGLAVNRPTSLPKHFWVDGFSGPDQSVSWTVKSNREAEFHVDLLADAPAGAELTVSVTDGAGSTIVHDESGWAKLDAGVITVPRGESVITVAKTSSGGTASIKSIELVASQAWSQFERRVEKFRLAAEPTRVELSQAGLGLMFQYGPWSYPTTGANPDIETHTDSFDVEAFADMVESTGAGYVIWSVSWWTYQLQAPNRAVDDIVGNGSRTSERDLIGDLAKEFQDRGLMFMLYYHTGQDEHLGYGSTDFWQGQDFPAEFTSTGGGDRSIFLKNWTKIVSELGNRYQGLVDGWFFDDGLIYYPADFEKLGDAARAGNAERLVSWNSWIASRYTDFQDVAFGEEGCFTQESEGTPEPGGDGILTAGKNEGLLEHCMERMEQDWGVRAANQPIQTLHNAESLYCAIEPRLERNTPVSLNLMMHYPGIPSENSLAVLRDLGERLESGAGSPLVNNNDSSIQYDPLGAWRYAGGRGGAGDHCSDVTYATANGSAFEYSFTGTGIDVLVAAGGVTRADVYLDGVLVDSIDRTDSGYLPQAVLYGVRDLAAGEHTVRVVKTGGQYLQLDALRLVP